MDDNAGVARAARAARATDWDNKIDSDRLNAANDSRARSISYFCVSLKFENSVSGGRDP